MLSPAHVYTALDVETTGLEADVHRIVEIAVIALDARGNEIAAFDTLVSPGDDPIGATGVHDLTDEMLTGAPSFTSIACWLGALLEGTVAVAHYARFDMGFVNAEFERSGIPLPALPSICTIEAARAGGVPGPYRMLDVARSLGIADGDFHHALFDTRTCAAIWRRLLDRPRVDPARLARVRAARAAGVPWPAANPTRPPRLLPRAAAEARRLGRAS